MPSTCCERDSAERTVDAPSNGPARVRARVRGERRLSASSGASTGLVGSDRPNRALRASAQPALSGDPSQSPERRLWCRSSRGRRPRWVGQRRSASVSETRSETRSEAYSRSIASTHAGGNRVAVILNVTRWLGELATDELTQRPPKRFDASRPPRGPRAVPPDEGIGTGIPPWLVRDHRRWRGERREDGKDTRRAHGLCANVGRDPIRFARREAPAE